MSKRYFNITISGWAENQLENEDKPVTDNELEDWMGNYNMELPSIGTQTEGLEVTEATIFWRDE